MGRFDPREGEDYGACVDCGLALATNEDAKEHRTETMQPGRSSRRTRGTNPDRASRIQSHIDSTVEAAISDALDDLQGDIDSGHLTEEEVVAALGWYSDFADAWKEQN